MRIATAMLFGFGLVFGNGCSSATDVNSSSQQMIYSRTIAHVGKDGIISQRMVRVTAAEQRAERQAIENGTALLKPGTGGGTSGTPPDSVLEDDSCAGSDIDLWDTTGGYGPGDELCLYVDVNGSTASLNDFEIWYGQGWGGQVESFYSGEYAGSLYESGVCSVGVGQETSTTKTEPCYGADTIYLWVPPN